MKNKALILGALIIGVSVTAVLAANKADLTAATGSARSSVASTFANLTSSRNNVQAKQARHTNSVGELNCEGVTRSLDGSQIKRLTGCLPATAAKKAAVKNVLPASSEARAMQYLGDVSEELGIKSLDKTLSLLKSDLVKDIAHVRFEQRYKGLRVLGASVAVHVDTKTDRIVLIDSDYVPGIAVRSVSPRTGKGKAQTIARSSFGPKAKMWRSPTSELLIYPVDGRVGVLAWRIVNAIAQPAGVWESIVDANSGLLIAKRRLSSEAGFDNSTAHTYQILFSDSDTYVSETPDVNHGTESELLVRSTLNDRSRSLLHFDLTALPENIAPTGATLRLWVLSPPSGTRTINAYGATPDASWDESGVTWDSAAPLFNDTSLDDSTIATTLPVRGWAQWIVDATATGWPASVQSQTFELRDASEGDSPGDEVAFASRETVLGRPPQLKVEFDVPTVDAPGRIFAPNPIVSSGSAVFSDNNDGDNFDLNNQRDLTTLYDLDPTFQVDLNLDGKYEQPLTGLWAKAIGPGAIQTDKGLVSEARETEATTNVLQCITGPCFGYPRSDNRFEEASAYGHVTDSHRYLASIGLEDILHRPLVANVNYSPAGIQMQNAFFDPESKELYFGSKGVDAAEDADVITHEYAHAIQDDVVPGFGLQEETRAIGEGFSDYFAFTMHSGDDEGPFGKECIGAWFARSLGRECVRRVDDTRKYPGAMQWEEHEDGNIWSSALHDIWESLGRQTADAIVINSNYYLNPDATFSEGLQALLLSDVELNGGANESTILSAFAERGIYPGPSSVSTPGSSLASGSPALVSWDRSGSGVESYQIEYTEDASRIGSLTDGFEDGFISPADYYLTKPAWRTTSKWSKNGLFSARSARIGHSEASYLTRTVYFPTRSTVQFDYRVNSEAGSELKSGDNLFFIACGSTGCTQLGVWSGKTSGRFKTNNLAPGLWVLEWVYAKDPKTSSGADAAYIDDVTFSKMYSPVWKSIDSLVDAETDSYSWSSPIVLSSYYQIRMRGLANATTTPWSYSSLFSVN